MTGTTNDNTEFTQFTNEACEATKVLGSYMPDSLVNAQVDVQDVKAYFSRPRLISRGSIPFGSTNQLTPGFAFNPNQITMRSIFPQWDQRLAGAFGIRFTLNFKLQVAATSFHQGLLCMCWQYGHTGLSNETYSRGIHSWSAPNLPHVRLDLAETTMVELSIPFLYSSEFMEITPYDTVSPYYTPYGQMTIVPLLPCISVPGLSAATYDVYCYLTDIELIGVDVINPALISLQSGDILSKEVKNSRIISGTLSNASKIASFVARGIPSLSAIAGPAAWALDTAAGVAKYFGYSKPMLQDPSHKIYRDDYGQENSVDVPVTGTVVGCFQGNTTTVSTSLGGTDVDEMALAFVTSQWSYVMKGFVNTTDTHGLPVYSAPVSPSVFWYRAPDMLPRSNIRFPSDDGDYAATSIMPSTLMYISSFFRQWRGSVKFRFTFAKTKLHGGRYMVTFNPYNTYQRNINNFGGVVLGPEVVSTLQQPYGDSMIMDLKDGNVFEFVAPYELATAFTDFTSSSGGISVVCMDPLQSTGTVTVTVPFMVEVCGGPDFELADFAGPYFIPHPSASIQVQSGDLVAAATKDPNRLTMGEKVTSLKQIIMQPTWYSLSFTNSAISKFAIPPWFANVNYNTTSTSNAFPNLPNLTFEGSTGGFLSQCYAFVKGGTDFHFYPQNNEVFGVVAQNANNADTSNGSIPSLFKRPFVSLIPKVTQLTSAVHARLPSFQTVVRIPARSYDAYYDKALAATSGGLPPFMSHSYNLHVNNRRTGIATGVAHRSAADDAAMAMFMGPVPIFIPNEVSTVRLDSQGWNF